MNKIAIPSKGGMIDDHFGHCEKFDFFTLSDKKEVVEHQVFAGSDTCGCKSDLAVDLKKEGVTVLLAAGIGKGAINKLKESGITVFSGFKGEVSKVLEMWLSGSVGNFTVCTSHGGDDHECSNH